MTWLLEPVRIMDIAALSAFPSNPLDEALLTDELSADDASDDDMCDKVDLAIMSGEGAQRR